MDYSPLVRDSRTFLDSGFHAVDSGLQVPHSSLCQWNLDSGLQSSVGFRFPTAVFRIPKPSILDSTFKIFLVSGILRTADVSPRSSPLRDVSRGRTSATQRQKFHTDDVNQCLHNKSGSHGVPNANLFNFTFLLVDFGKVLCSSANELHKSQILTIS